MNKVCEECKQEFTQKQNVRGSEQKYCSVKCRQTSAQNRMINKIKNEARQETKIEAVPPVAEITQAIYGNGGRDNSRADNGTRFISDNHLSTLEKLFETKNEVIFYKLRCENLQKENQQLIIDVNNLEMELEEDAEGEEKSGYENILGGIMDEFKKDPLNTINFASELIGTLLKPKTKINA